MSRAYRGYLDCLEATVFWIRNLDCVDPRFLSWNRQAHSRRPLRRTGNPGRTGCEPEKGTACREAIRCRKPRRARVPPREEDIAFLISRGAVKLSRFLTPIPSRLSAQEVRLVRNSV
jgi:hypothetical protein